MKACTKDGVLYIVPENNLVAGRVEDMRNFFIAQLKANPDEHTVTLDASGIGVVDSPGVNLIIGLYKHVSAESKTFTLINADETFMKVAHFFGFPAMFKVEGTQKRAKHALGTPRAGDMHD
jgi:ABC-type transporter Mla MlaB component